MIRGVRALGAALAVSPKTATKYINDDRWPYGRGPWSPQQIASAKAWRHQHYPTPDETRARGVGEPANGEGSSSDPLAELRNLTPERRARLSLIVERTIAQKYQNALLVGGLVK